MGPADQEEIDLATTRLSGLFARHMPDFLQSLVLVGSAVDGDYRAGRSDLDFVAVLHRPPSEAELDGLTIIHRLYAADMTLPRLDGIWVTEADLAAGPDAAALGPSTESGSFLAAARGNRNPVTWLMLADRGRPIVGTFEPQRIWRDAARLASWTRDNVDAYWARWLADSSRLLTRRGLALFRGEAVMWGVLGISRLHYTLATGRIASKSGAGEYALTAFEPRWHHIVDEALRIRRRDSRKSLYGSPLARRRDALAFVAMAIDAIRAGHWASE